MFTGIKYELQNLDSVGGSDAGGMGAVSTDTTAVDNSLSTGEAQGQPAPETQPSMLSSAQNDQAGENQTTDELLAFPDKYTVKNPDGTVNRDESTRKLLEGYKHLSKKMGETGGIVPDNPDGYKIDFKPADLGLPENLTPEMVKNDEDFKKFAEQAHGLGFTNEQINLVASKYLEVINSALDRRDENDMNACREELMKTWTNQGELDTGLKNAVRAFNHFASEQDRGLIDVIGNNPIVVRLLANIGATMREDSPVRNAQPMESKETITSLMKSEAYMNPKHPEHDAVYRQVTNYYQRAVNDD